MTVETPAAVVDLGRLERNLERWQEHCDRVGLANRPHVKTHRSIEIARRQLALGAVGITCQKLGEAEVMAEGGCTDILVSYNILGERKLERVRRLLDRAVLTVVADHPDLLPGLGAAAAGASRPLRVLVECDTGLGRNGVATPQAAAALAETMNKPDNKMFRVMPGRFMLVVPSSNYVHRPKAAVAPPIYQIHPLRPSSPRT